MQPLGNKLKTKRVLAFAFLLLAGALTSVIVAWGVELYLVCFSSNGGQWGLFSGRTRYDYADPEDQDRCLSRFDYGGVGCTVCWIFRGGFVHLPSAKEIHLPPPPDWFVPPNHDEWLRGSAAYGLPFRCLKYDWVPRSDGFIPTRDSYRHAIYWELDGGKKQAVLPTAPLRPGLLLNTLFYATLFSTPYLLRQTRRHLRLRRGHCPTCNYDLRGQPNLCPECGHAPTPA